MVCNEHQTSPAYGHRLPQALVTRPAATAVAAAAHHLTPPHRFDDMLHRACAAVLVQHGGDAARNRRHVLLSTGPGARVAPRPAGRGARTAEVACPGGACARPGSAAAVPGCGSRARPEAEPDSVPGRAGTGGARVLEPWLALASWVPCQGAAPGVFGLCLVHSAASGLSRGAGGAAKGAAPRVPPRVGRVRVPPLGTGSVGIPH